MHSYRYHNMQNNACKGLQDQITILHDLTPIRYTFVYVTTFYKNIQKLDSDKLLVYKISQKR